MNVILVTTFRASRKDPLAEVLQRIHGAFLSSGLGDPHVAFAFADSPVPGFTSSVDRVLKRHPDLQRFLSTHAPLPALPPVRQISNDGLSPARGEVIDFSKLLTIAAGVPRSFPFHNIAIHFRSPAFGVALEGPFGQRTPGVTVGDSWWVNGRTRSVSAISSVEADPSAKKLPPHPAAVAAVLAACGKAQKTVQIPLADGAAAGGQPMMAPPEVTRKVQEVVHDYRARMPEVMERARLPHDLPPTLEALNLVSIGEKSGPKKPALVEAFAPMGYDCRGDSGTFTLRRRTPANLTVAINLDVGSWSNSLTAFYVVTGFGFRTVLSLPASRRASTGQYAIGGAERWKQIVENLAALVAELDRTLVPAIEAAAGPAPDWYQPEA